MIKEAVNALTPLQRRVLGLVASGDTNKEIAAAIGVSIAGAKKHVAALRKRYGVANRAAVVRAAIEAGELVVGQKVDPRSVAIGARVEAKPEP